MLSITNQKVRNSQSTAAKQSRRKLLSAHHTTIVLHVAYTPFAKLLNIHKFHISTKALSVFLFVAAIAGCGSDKSSTPTPEEIITSVHTARTRTQSEFSYPVTFYGRIQPARRTSLAFELPGKITALLVDEGQSIDRGKPIARLDTSILAAEKKILLARRSVEQSVLRRLVNGERKEVVIAAEATVRGLEAELAQAILDRDRTEKLKSQKAVSESEYEVVLYKAKSIQASLDAERSRLKELETGTREEDVEAQRNRLLQIDAEISSLNVRIDKAVLLAPFDANIVQRLADEGAVVRQGQEVIVLTELGEHEARFSIPLYHLQEAHAKKAVAVRGKQIPTKGVRAIASVLPDTRAVDVVFTLESSSAIFEGQSCTLSLVKQVAVTCVELPASALVPSLRGLWSVYRLEEARVPGNFRVIREEVSINHSDGDRVVVESSLPDGSLVVSEGVHKLVPGMLVRLKDDRK